MGILDYIRGFLFLIFVAFLIQKISNISFKDPHKENKNSVFPERNYHFFEHYSSENDDNKRESDSITIGHIATKEERETSTHEYNKNNPTIMRSVYELEPFTEKSINELKTGITIGDSWTKNSIGGEWERD